MSRQQMQRTKFVYHFLHTADAHAAAKYAGISSHNALQRIRELLGKNGSLAELEHHREAVKFTPGVLQAAKDYLVENQHMEVTTGEIIAFLEREKQLEPPTNKHNFLGKFQHGWQSRGGPCQ
jgi:hypothetical protein